MKLFMVPNPKSMSGPEAPWMETEYVWSFPVPGPDTPGSKLLLTLAPDRSPIAVAVDYVIVDGRLVRGRLGDTRRVADATATNSADVVAIPTDAPWLLISRDLLQYKSRAEVQKAMATWIEKTLDQALGGSGDSGDSGDSEASDHDSSEDRGSGQYL